MTSLYFSGRNNTGIQQEKYNMSIRILSQICEAQNVKLSTIFKEIGE